MTTKKPAASCKVPTRRPSRDRYAALRSEVAAAKKGLRTKATVPVPDPKPPHKIPPYGGKCWLQSGAESAAYIKAAKLTQQLRQALYEYDLAWNAMECCLNGYPA